MDLPIPNNLPASSTDIVSRSGLCKYIAVNPVLFWFNMNILCKVYECNCTLLVQIRSNALTRRW